MLKVQEDLTIIHIFEAPWVQGYTLAKLEDNVHVRKVNYLEEANCINYNIVLYCIALHCIVLYCIVLYCIVLYCIVYELFLTTNLQI